MGGPPVCLLAAAMAAAWLAIFRPQPLVPDPGVSSPRSDACYTSWVTGYVRTEHSPWTYDGTSIYTDEPIAASAPDLPIDTMVWIDGLGTFRIADRGGGLGSAGWIDVAVWTRAEAFAITGYRTICISPPA
jgi:3D (Asp-Asp-Asp) domain-containing protein